MSASERRRPPSLATVCPAADPAFVLVLAATMLGLALRSAAAAGDLGLDEIWSLKLVGRVQSLGEVFWGISHDNNHLLNSAWLYLMGQDAPVWAYRLPAVVMGTLTVPALARLCGRWRPAAGPLAAAFGAVALPLVDFGSEARGYAGLVLATVLAFDAAGRAVDGTLAGDRATCRREAWRLGAAVGFGLLSHLTMTYAIAVLGVATLIRVQARCSPLRSLWAMLRVFLPSVLLALPAAACILAGIAVRGSFTIGDTDPFTFSKLMEGFGSMALLTLGLPDTLPASLGVAGALGLVVIAGHRHLSSPWALAIATAALAALPLAVAGLHLPNVVYPRYFSVCAIALLSVTAELLSTLWGRGEDKRAAALTALAMVAGSLVLDAMEIRDGRSGATETLALIRAEGTPTYAADHPSMAAMLLDEAARRDGGWGLQAVKTDACLAPPYWFIAVGAVDRRPDASAVFGSPECRATYGLQRVYDASRLSGTPWTVYRRR